MLCRHLTSPKQCLEHLCGEGPQCLLLLLWRIPPPEMATCRLDQESLWYVGISYLLITTSLINVWEDHQPMASKRCKKETCWIKWKLWQTIWVHDSYTSFFLTKDSDTEMQLEWLVCAIATSPFKLKPYWAPISAFPNSMVSKPSENLEGSMQFMCFLDG